MSRSHTDVVLVVFIGLSVILGLLIALGIILRNL